ncbi:hypothetical protein ACVWZA_002907 [Sphingomonas sp. UYAg733]
MQRPAARCRFVGKRFIESALRDAHFAAIAGNGVSVVGLHHVKERVGRSAIADRMNNGHDGGVFESRGWRLADAAHDQWAVTINQLAAVDPDSRGYGSRYGKSIF